MKNFIKIVGLGVSLFTSQIIFGQNLDEKVSYGHLDFKADRIKIDNASNIVVYEGNVSLNSNNVTFDSADKIIFDTKNQKMEIYRPKKFKFISMESVHIKNKNIPYLDFVTFYPKKGRLEF